MWLQRASSVIKNRGPIVGVVARRCFGIEQLVAGLEEPHTSVLKLDLAEKEKNDPVALGNALSDEIQRVTGVRIFGYGMPLIYGIERLKAHLPYLGRVRIALLGCDDASWAVHHFVDLAAERVQVIFHGEERLLPDIRQAVYEPPITEKDLQITEGEAAIEAGSAISGALVHKVWKGSDGSYLGFLRKLRLQGETPQISPQPALRDLDQAEFALLLDLCVRQSRWIEVLELAVVHDHSIAERYLAQCAREFLNRGLFDRLWALLNKLPERITQSPENLYWYFVSALAVNKHREVMSQVSSLLAHHEAPELRARVAAAIPGDDSLHEAQRAYKVNKSINTARAYGFVLTMNGRFSEATAVLREGLKAAEAVSDFRNIVAAASDMSHSLLFAGDFRSAKAWARWGTRVYEQNGLGDELLKLTVINQWAFSALITDEVDTATDLLGDIVITDDLLGIPSIEGIASTVADVKMLACDHEAAIAIYEAIFAVASRNIIGFGALDLARAHCVAGNTARAQEVASEACATAHESSPSNVCASHLAMAHVESQLNPQGSIERYEYVLATYYEHIGAPMRVQAVLGLANVLEVTGRGNDARNQLNDELELVTSLGQSGWKLALPNHAQAEYLWDRLNGVPDTYSFQFLAERWCRGPEEAHVLSHRSAEILSILADHETGLSGEALLLEVYGDEGKLGTLKGNLSRLRQNVPIESQPYRLSAAYKADFLDVERLIGEGKVREALELYKGPLLPESEAPGVCRLRERVDEAVRQAVMHAGEPDLLLRLAKKFPDDLELWERTQDVTPTSDPAYPLVRARIRRILGEWEL